MRTDVQTHPTQTFRDLSAQELLAVGGGLYIVDEWGSAGGGGSDCYYTDTGVTCAPFPEPSEPGLGTVITIPRYGLVVNAVNLGISALDAAASAVQSFATDTYEGIVNIYSPKY